jgi:hypothetical protein
MIYSDRPYMKMAGELVGHNYHITLRSYDERFRQFRRLFHGSTFTSIVIVVGY